MSHPSSYPALLFPFVDVIHQATNRFPGQQQSLTAEMTASKPNEEHRSWNDFPAAGCYPSKF